MAVSSILARLRSLWRSLFHHADMEAEMTEEFHHHLKLRTDDLIRGGLSPDDAARRARIEFGHIDSHKEDARISRGLGPFNEILFSVLDIKLGVRMLAKHPGLTLVSVIGMSVAIAIGAGGFSLVHDLVGPDLPIDEGERVVALQNTDPRNPGNPEEHALHDFLLWREKLRSVKDLSAFRTEFGTIAIPGGAMEQAPIAWITASGFRVARVAPLVGRPLMDEDEAEGATPVVVIAYEEWQRHFGGDPEILGRTVRIDATVHTVVGVMPEGFRFPVNHRYWVPLRLDPTAHEVGAGPEITMFGRLADDVTVERAQTELTEIGRHTAAAYPRTHEHLRPRVLPYTQSFMGIDSPARAWLLRTVKFSLSLLLVVVAVNVAILVYARTAARMGEIAVRCALGASRRRVVTQLFAEALMLSVTAALVGLFVAALGFDWFEMLLNQTNPEGLPFWVDLGLSPALAAYVAGLTVLAAVIVGIIPALKATGEVIQTRLQALHSGGSRLRLGPSWTTLIVIQVAIAVAVLPYALYVAGPSIARGLAEPDYAVDEFLRASLSFEREGVTAGPDRDEAVAVDFIDSATELLRRLEEDPAVAGVAFASRFPGGEAVVGIDVEGSGTPASVWFNQVDTNLFTIFDVPILAGREFIASDGASGSNAVVVDTVFAKEVLRGEEVLGRRVRLLRGPGDDASSDRSEGPWLEIVGVVPQFTVPPVFQRVAPKLYQPISLADVPGVVQLTIRLRHNTTPAAFASQLWEITDAVDPDLRLSLVQTASAAEDVRQQGLHFLSLVIVLVTGSVLLLSAAGIYAMMSFTVASRRREIGIRTALGAAPARVLHGIFKRACGQLGAGVLFGLVFAELLVRAGGGSFLRGEDAYLLPTVASLMTAIGLVAAVGPARRGLAVQPTEALREE